MMNIVLRSAAALLLMAGGNAHGAGLTAEVRDQSGEPVPDAVVSLASEDGHATPVPPRSAQERLIDQRNETFLPFVTIVPRGGKVSFSNSDKTQHHVYSFSPAKRFQFLLNPGERSAPLVFEQQGVAAIGCNIHDQMITYVFVAESPYAALTDARGLAEITELPEGSYLVSIWHPRLKPGSQDPAQRILIGARSVTLRLTVPLFAMQEPDAHRRRYD
jgi:plastocyanin